ncbi:MAG: DUF4091 domain-containing protein [Clostridia bacterium]|nr:DUF4091 domain-containing protein [Clostridia bacterium]
MYTFKAISAMEKVLPAGKPEETAAIKSVRGLKGERVSFQIRADFVHPEDGRWNRKRGYFTLRSPLRTATRIARVGYIPVMLPAYPDRSDEDYISKQPGLYPDVLYPVKVKEEMNFDVYAPTVFMVTVDIPADQPAGEYPLYFTFTLGETQKYSLKVTVQVEELALAKNDLIFTQWFHCDSIAVYHGVKMMSKRHWKLIESFIKTAARTGINMILTPLFTPPLDTAIGTERPTMQLVKVKKTGDKYEFDFTLLKKWIDLCHQYGIEYFELSHLFTQWGVEKCPKIVVEIDGKDVKEFGWHTAAMGDLYKNFLSQFLPALTAKLREYGVAEKCYFHISDEPSAKREGDYENYLAAKNFITPYIEGFKVTDALSNVEFYQNGLIDIPICATNHLEPFMEEEIEERWCYYCCGQGEEVGNRFLAMPSYRNRILGVQMFQWDMSGFLQWGYNFYFTERARQPIDPYHNADGLMAWPAGDPFSVYPWKDEAIESIRTVVFYQAIQDRTLLKMLAEKIGPEKTKQWVNQQAGMEITFKKYPKNNAFLEDLHDKIIEKLLEK